MKRLQIYKLIAILLPFLILVVIELCMRAGNYGYNIKLFITDEDTRFWVMNREISQKYFTISQNATIGNQEAFYKKTRRHTPFFCPRRILCYRFSLYA